MTARATHAKNVASGFIRMRKESQNANHALRDIPPPLRDPRTVGIVDVSN